MPVCDSDAMLSVPALSAPIMASETAFENRDNPSSRRVIFSGSEASDGWDGLAAGAAWRRRKDQRGSQRLPADASWLTELHTCKLRLSEAKWPYSTEYVLLRTNYCDFANWQT